MHHKIDSVNYPEHVVDRAYDLLIKSNKVYRQIKKLLLDLNAIHPEDQPVNNHDFSMSKTLIFQKDATIERSSKELLALPRRYEIAQKMCNLLLQKTKICFDETSGLFVNEQNPSEQWGQLSAGKKSENTDFRKVDFSEICDHISQAKFRVDIQHTYITDITQLHKTCIGVLENNPKCKFRVMVMEPNSTALLLRERSLSKKGKQPELIQSKSKENFRLFSELAEEYPKNFEFTTYDEMPGTVVYRIDQKIFVGFQWSHKYIYEGCYYVADVKPGNDFQADIENQFNQMWNENIEPVAYTNAYSMFFQRGKQQTEYVLQFNSQSLKACLTRTKHGLDFHGFMLEQENNNHQCAFHLTTAYSNVEEKIGEKRCAQIHTNISRRNWKQEGMVYVGQYSVLTNDALLKSNTVLFIRQSEVETLTAEQKALIHQFLSINHSAQNNSEIEIPVEIVNWDKLIDWVEFHHKGK